MPARAATCTCIGMRINVAHDVILTELKKFFPAIFFHPVVITLILSYLVFQVVNQYTHLDLLAPMPDVEVDKQRMLIVEGSLKYRDHSNTRVSGRVVITTLSHHKTCRHTHMCCVRTCTCTYASAHTRTHVCNTYTHTCMCAYIQILK